MITETQIDNNNIVTIIYNDLKFEIDVINDILLFSDEIYDLFPEDENHIETQPLNVFLSRLIDNWNLKKSISNDININI